MLFDGVEVGRTTLATAPSFVTPFGELVTCAVAGELDTRRSVPAEQRLLPSGAEWRRWCTDSVVAEVLIGPYFPVLPPEMDVAGCQAAVWRVQANRHVVEPALSCQWHILPAGAQGGPNAGESLDAQNWDIGKVTLSLGTEDGEYLAARAKQGLHVPGRLAPELHAGTVQYIDHGLRVPFSSLQPDEIVQVHFIVAWASHDQANRADTWFAVDQLPSALLRQLLI